MDTGALVVGKLYLTFQGGVTDGCKLPDVGSSN